MVSVEGDQSDMYNNVTNAPNISTLDDHDTDGKHVDSFEADHAEAHRLGFVTDEIPTGECWSREQQSND